MAELYISTHEGASHLFWCLFVLLLKTAKESRFWGIPEKVMSYALTLEETTMPRSSVQIANGKDCWKL